MSFFSPGKCTYIRIASDGKPGTDGTFPFFLIALFIESNRALSLVGRWPRRSTAFAWGKLALGGLFKGFNERGRSQRSSAMCTLSQRLQLLLSLTYGQKFLPP